VQELIDGKVRVSEVRGVTGVGRGGEVRGKPGAMADRQWAVVEEGGAARHRGGDAGCGRRWWAEWPAVEAEGSGAWRKKMIE
jgi:hypothetical protein